MTRKIIILGTGGSSTDIFDAILDINQAHGRTVYQCLGFLDDNSKIWGKMHSGVQVLGPLKEALEYEDCFFVNGIGSPKNFLKKETIIGHTSVPIERFETIIHPTASVSRMARLGPGTVVLQNVTICSNVNVESHVIVLPNSILSHHCIVGAYSCIAGGACVSGAVRIGRSCYIGSNAVLIEGIGIGDRSLIGMGSVVTTSVDPDTVVAGNPAKVVRGSL